MAIEVHALWVLPMPYGLEETAPIFRETSVVEDTDIIGMVQKLEHRGGDHGKVTVLTVGDGEHRAVTMELSGADHSAAVNAYENRIPVTCVGELAREGRSWVLRNPRDFALVQQES
jgi:hypothetical protein